MVSFVVNTHLCHAAQPDSYASFTQVYLSVRPCKEHVCQHGDAQVFCASPFWQSYSCQLGCCGWMDTAGAPNLTAVWDGWVRVHIPKCRQCAFGETHMNVKLWAVGVFVQSLHPNWHEWVLAWGCTGQLCIPRWANTARALILLFPILALAPVLPAWCLDSLAGVIIFLYLWQKA